VTRQIVAAAGLALSAAVLIATVPAEAARFCKDGYVTYASREAAPSREAAEAAAIRVWQRTHEHSLPRSDQMHCMRSEDHTLWRCFIRAGHCKTA
jgi:hypothetical protein